MRVLAVDPGMATGMAAWDDCKCPGGGRLRVWELDEPLQVAEAVWLACAAKTLDELVVENFRLGGGKAMTTTGTRITIELIGMLRFAAHHHGTPIEFQWPEDAKTFSTNDKLARMGWTTPSKPDHMRSAARHLLLRLVRRGTVDGAALLP